MRAVRVFLILTLLLFAAPTAAAEAWIVSDPGGSTSGRLLDTGLPHHRYENLDLVAFEADPTTARFVASLAGVPLYPAETYDLHLDTSVPLIEADRVQKAVGLQRQGPSVLVVDTGVDSTHPDFSDSLVLNLAADRSGGLVAGTFVPDVVIDESGHGTHVAGIVAGTGEASGTQDPLNGRYVGVYANGRIIGFQAATTTDDEPGVDSLSALEAFDWALENQDQYKVRVVTNSWGLAGDLDPDHPVVEATQRLYLAGITVVFSAGNLGNSGESEQLNKFCQAPWVLCIAAGDASKGLASLSSRGDPSRPYGHPDLTAPGFRITATDSLADPDPTGGIFGTLAGEPTRSLYTERSGSSMATPHVAGAAALLLAANPALSPDQVMDILVETADSMPEGTTDAGAGYLNVRQAYNLAVQTEGERKAFLAGELVKYAGPRSGDDLYEDDPVSIGYTGTPSGGAKLLSEPTDEWIGLGSTPFWVLTGLGLIGLIAGTSFRSRHRPLVDPSTPTEGEGEQQGRDR